MPVYMLQDAYTSEGMKSLTQNPENRTTAVSEQLQKLGGRLIGLYYSFGDYDAVVIFETPDDTTAAAFAMSFAAAGFMRKVKTTVLLTPEQAVDAMRKAGAAPYGAPGIGS